MGLAQLGIHPAPPMLGKGCCWEEVRLCCDTHLISQSSLPFSESLLLNYTEKGPQEQFCLHPGSSLYAPPCYFFVLATWLLL